MSESQEKKRRRDSDDDDDDDDRPQKKLVSAVENIKFSVVQDIGDWCPALVFTPGLDYEFQTPMDVYSRTRSAANEKSNVDILLHSAGHPKLDYVAREEKAGDVQSLLQHYLAIHDPETGDTQVVPARRLVLRSMLQSARMPEEIEEKTPARKSAIESRTLLGEAFGTKKSQKALRSLTENAIISPQKIRKDSKGKLILEDAAAIVIDAMGETTSLSTREVLQDAIDESKPKPKANLAAEALADVYRVQELAGNEILTRLNIKSLKNAVKNKQDVLTTSRYFSNRLVRVVAENKDDSLRALRLLLILVELKKTFKAGRRDTWMLAKDEDIQSLITDYDSMMMTKIKRKFTPNNTISPWHMDNICTHVCALALIVDNYTTDCFDLKHDLGIDNRKINQYFKEIGCHISPPKESDFKELGIKTKSEANSHMVAKLRIPLVFPKMRAPMRKR